MLLRCSGLIVGDLSVPAFAVAEAEVVGLALEGECGDSWYGLLQILSGTVAHPAVVVTSNAKPITPWRQSQQSSIPACRLHDLLLAEGVSDDLAHDLLGRIGLNRDVVPEKLQLTERMLLRLGIARAMGARLVVLDSGGLDPIGFARVLQDLFSNVATCSALDLFSLKTGQPTHWYSRIIHCPLL